MHTCFCFFSPQLLTANQLLQQTQQPYSYLIETVRQRDAQISTMKGRISSLEDDVRYMYTTHKHRGGTSLCASRNFTEKKINTFSIGSSVLLAKIFLCYLNSLHLVSCNLLLMAVCHTSTPLGVSALSLSAFVFFWASHT